MPYKDHKLANQLTMAMEIVAKVRENGGVANVGADHSFNKGERFQLPITSRATHRLGSLMHIIIFLRGDAVDDTLAASECVVVCQALPLFHRRRH